MSKRLYFGSIIVQVICWGIVIGMFLQSNYSVEARTLIQTISTPEPFLGPIYYEKHDIYNIIDHNLPLASTGDDGNHIVLHNNGVSYNATPMPDNGFGYDEHGGIDFDLKYDPILASADGTVAKAEWHHPANHRSGFGLYIQLDHGTYSTLYAHLSALFVKFGDPIVADPLNRNGIIGISGNTGSVFGGCPDVGNDPNCSDHLHFEVREGLGYKPIDPYGWIGNEQPTPVSDPWAYYENPEGTPIGATSHNLWENAPAVWSTTDQYPGGTPVAEPPVADDYSIELDDGDADVFKTVGTCWDVYGGGGSVNFGYRAAEGVASSACSATWTIHHETEAPAGDYDVYVNIPDGATSNHALYEIYHDKTTDEAIVVQAAYPDNDEHEAWAYLGRYYFRMNGHDLYPGSKEYIQITNQTEEDSFGTTIVADAVRLYPASPAPDLEVFVQQKEGDAGGPNNTNLETCSAASNGFNEIYFGHCDDETPTISGFHFPEVALPDGVTITAARLEFTADASSNTASDIDVKFQGELADNAAIFDPSLPSDRTSLTNEFVPWHIPSDEIWIMPEVIISPDISSVIQEVIDQEGWQSGNAIAIIVQPTDTDTTSRRVFGWDRNKDSIHSARLQIWYTEPEPPTPTPTPTPSLPSAPVKLTAVYDAGDNVFLNDIVPLPSHVKLTWYPVSISAETTFNIYRGRGIRPPIPLDAAHLIISSITTRQFNDLDGQPGDLYVVTAVNAVGESAPSNTAYAKPLN